jgi:hypothetical protein
MATPFFRGQNFADWLVAILLQSAADFGDERTVQDACLIVGPAVVKRFLQRTSTFPDVFTAVTDDYVFVISASTQGAVQWVGNVLGSATDTLGVFPDEVSKYFGITAIFQFDTVVSEVMRNISSRKLVLIGFSLGAATCTIMKVLFKGQGIDPIAVFAFASPRPGTQSFVDHNDWTNYQRIAVQDDPIPSVPPVRWSTRGLYTGFTWLPPTSIYGSPTPAWAFARDGVLHEGQFDQNLPEVIYNVYSGDVYRTHNQPYYALAMRRFLPDKLPLGFDGFAQGEDIDSVAKSVLKPMPAWPWPVLTPTILHGGVSDMGSLISIFMRDQPRNKGYGENYYSTTAASSALLTSVVNNLLPARRKMLAKAQTPSARNGMEIYGARVANVGSPRQSFLYKPTAPLLGTLPYISGMATIEDCAIYMGFDATNSFKRQFHFRGIDAGYIADEQVPEGGTLDDLINGASISSLVNILKGLGVAVHSTRPAIPLSYKVTAANQPTQGALITLTTDNAVGFDPGTLWDLRGVRGAPLLGGRYQSVSGKVPFLITLSGSQRYSAPAIITGTLYQVGANYQALDHLSLLGAGKKNTGRPPFSPRGRRSPQLRRR